MFADMRKIAVTEAEADNDDSRDEEHFERGDEDLYVAAGAHAYVVDGGQGEDERDGN